MDQHSHSKLSLFLMELIMAIMFFSLAAAVCVRLFVGAHSMSEQTKDLNNATIWCQNLAEAFTGQNGDLVRIGELFPGSYIASSADGDGCEGTLILFFDKDWERFSEVPSGAYYEAILEIKKSDADDVYSDVNTYGVSLEGKAAMGKIAVIYSGADTEIIPSIPEDEKIIILSDAVDVYLGKEEP